MLMPKKVKFRKQQRGRMTGKAWRGSELAYGDYGLKVIEPGWITDRQIEASRVAMTRFIKRGGKIWLRLFPDKPVTKKPAETRMGKGQHVHVPAAVRLGRPDLLRRHATSLMAQTAHGVASPAAVIAAGPAGYSCFRLTR